MTSRCQSLLCLLDCLVLIKEAQVWLDSRGDEECPSLGRSGQRLDLSSTPGPQGQWENPEPRPDSLGGAPHANPCWPPAFPAGQAIKAWPEKKLHCTPRRDNFQAGGLLHTGMQASRPPSRLSFHFVLALTQNPRDKSSLRAPPLSYSPFFLTSSSLTTLWKGAHTPCWPRGLSSEIGSRVGLPRHQLLQELQTSLTQTQSGANLSPSCWRTEGNNSFQGFSDSPSPGCGGRTLRNERNKEAKKCETGTLRPSLLELPALCLPHLAPPSSLPGMTARITEDSST